jgi:hypothetical protein
MEDWLKLRRRNMIRVLQTVGEKSWEGFLMATMK